MGAVPASGDLITMRIKGNVASNPVQNDLSFYILNPAANWSDQVSQAVSDLDDALGVVSGTGLWGGGLSTAYLLEAIEVVDVMPGTSPLGSVVSGVAGTGDPGALPANDSLAMTLRSDFKGPGGRGRIYLTGFSPTAQSGGFWEGGAQDYASGIGSRLLTNFGELAGGANMRWIIIHKTSNGGVRHAPVVKLVPPEVKPVMSFTVHNEVRSIGRRATGRRVHRTLKV